VSATSTSGTEQTVSFALSNLDTVVLIASCLGASVLCLVRLKTNRQNTIQQWFFDALSCGTITILLMMGLRSLVGARWGLDGVVRTNGYLIEIALIYCTIVLGVGLKKSCERLNQSTPDSLPKVGEPSSSSKPDLEDDRTSRR
jgi:hypothetical protein